MSAAKQDRLAISAGIETEALVNYIFTELPNEVVDTIDLTRIPKSEKNVARELVTAAAILAIPSAAIARSIFRLIERWMEQRREGKAIELIYEAATGPNPEVVPVLERLEKAHSELAAKTGLITVDWIKNKKEGASG
jgi:hypothetical protein